MGVRERGGGWSIRCAEYFNFATVVVVWANLDVESSFDWWGVLTGPSPQFLPAPLLEIVAKGLATPVGYFSILTLIYMCGTVLKYHTFRILLCENH